MSGVIPSQEFNAQIVRVVKQVLREQRGGAVDSRGPRSRGLEVQWAISDEAISSASNGLTAPGSGSVTLLKMDTNQDLSQSDTTLTAVNRSESVAIAADTLLMVALFRGEWVIIWADCAALLSPPT